MKGKEKILGTTNESEWDELTRFLHFWNSAPTIYEFNTFASGMKLRAQYIYWMAKYPNHNIPWED